MPLRRQFMVLWIHSRSCQDVLVTLSAFTLGVQGTPARGREVCQRMSLLELIEAKLISSFSQPRSYPNNQVTGVIPVSHFPQELLPRLSCRCVVLLLCCFRLLEL